MGKRNAPDLVKLLLEHRDGLFGFILALTRDREAAEEVFQEVSLAVVEESNRRTHVAQFLPWVHEIARRRVAEHFRKNARRNAIERRESLDDVVGQAFEENVTDVHAHLRRQDYLDQCTEEPPHMQRQMIRKRYRDRASIKKIAEAFDWTKEAVKVSLWNARRRLAACIDEKMRLPRETDS
ncbi:MAG: sigma-70 family RNA polymerase sigma factor [Planctomycetes bacterium]|nr:sigma-70 family RNA polymerase sigma factor [Planctomycetota bacterium]